jgi:acetate kinase
MYVLVVNAGSSSLKLAIVEHRDGRRVAERRVERVGQEVPDHHAALAQALPELLSNLPANASIGAVGHRVVHGGASFTAPCRIDDRAIAQLEALSPLAPLHNPANIAGIRAARALLPDAPHVAVFDTAFHHTLPNRAKRYAIPQDVADTHGIRRFGFHGTSHQYVAEKAAAYLGEPVRQLRLITLHLGNGCSAAAVEYGRSVETSMGMTPLEGLVMGSRGGDLDPGAILHLLRSGYDVDALDRLLNRQSGLAGLSGAGNDLRDIEARAAEGDEQARAAIQVFAHRVRKYVGAYAAVMGGVDAIVFTAGIGENSAQMRHRIASRLEYLGARLDEDANRDAAVSHEHAVADISEAQSRVRVLVVRTDEEHAIARDAARVAQELSPLSADDTIPVAISARHVHLSEADLATLFGAGATLTPKRALSQPGQFACEQTVTLVGPKRSLEGVGIIGPTRRQTQVEIARTDEFHLGLDAPIRASGELTGSPGITIVGPHGQVTIPEGVIQAQRHIHMHPDDADRFGVRHLDLVEVEIDSAQRDVVFRDVVVRVDPSFRLEMHLDTDEGNACDLGRDASGVLHVTTTQVRTLKPPPSR